MKAKTRMISRSKKSQSKSKTVKKNLRGRRACASLISVKPIRDRCQQLQNHSDVELRNVADAFRSKRQDDNRKTEAFALACEAVRRSTGKTFYDVQLQAGEVLARGDLAEMATGEGKTLVTALPVIHSVLAGKDVHVATTNSYLAERDCQEVQPALELLGMTVGLLPEDNDDNLKKQAYACDVTYGTGYEFGFDYLRDQLLLRNQRQDQLGDAWLRELSGHQVADAELVQPVRQVAIVDEIDSVLIDEANTPLVISFFKGREVDSTPFLLAGQVADLLKKDVDYTVDVPKSRIAILQCGMDKMQARANQPTGMQLNRPWRIYVEQALRARHVLQRDIEYVVQDDAVALVDQHTGRIFPERKWRDGLHQAVEAKEGVALTGETNSFARISRQRLFTLYEMGTGMTGTATDAVSEFSEFYQLDVVPIPLNHPCRRKGFPCRFFANNDAKYAAILDDVVQRHQTGQPILLGVRTVQQSWILSDLLHQAGISHQTLNGVQDKEEADVIAIAGKTGAVTVATNMAGRGTDIKLCDKSRAAGGLHVVVAEPNRSHRVDRQLIGRSARQNDPGSYQLFVSSEDEVLNIVNDVTKKKIARRSDRAGECHLPLTPVLLAAQKQAEALDFKQRKHLMQQECWVDGVLDTLVGAS